MYVLFAKKKKKKSRSTLNNLHILISLTSLMVITNLMRKLYNTSLLTESQASVKSMNSWRIVSLYSNFFSYISWMQTILSVVDMLHQNAHSWSPTILSTSWLNLERLLDKSFYKADNSVIPKNYGSQLVLSPYL
jgi:hypothetical protein